MESDSAWSNAVRHTFGSQLKALRLANSVSQEELALRCGLDRSYVGQVERGERNLTLENIYKIADGLGVPPSVLLQPLSENPNFSNLEGRQ